MPDFYTEDRSRLNDQPKRTIGDYVEENGFLVAPRLTLKEAKKHSGKVFVRSEHEQEYDGISGLLESFMRMSYFHETSLDDIETMEELNEKYFNKAKEARISIPTFCDFKGIDEQTFRNGVSFSLWAYIPGFNRTIVADSSVPNRWHVMTNIPVRDGNEGDFAYANYTVVTKERIKQYGHSKLTPELKKGLPDLINTYESIRHLANFDPSNCPIMEFQTVDEKNIFLQYHKTRTFTPSIFVLDRPPEKGELVLPFVRGITPPEGNNLKMSVSFADNKDWKSNIESADGSFDYTHDNFYLELQSPTSKLQIVGGNTVDHPLDDAAAKHFVRSLLFKPEVSAIIPIRKQLIRKGEPTYHVYAPKSERKDTFMNVHIISDGTTAYIKRLD